MKFFIPLFSLLFGILALNTDLQARGDGRRGGGGGGGGGGGQRSPMTGTKVQRPAARPNPQPASRPAPSKPAARPEARPAAPQVNRPAAPPVNRPSVERPTTRPGGGGGGDNRPDLNRPGGGGGGGDNKPDLNRPGGGGGGGDNKPDINRPGGGNNGPMADKRPDNRPGDGNKLPGGGNNGPGGDKRPDLNRPDGGGNGRVDNLRPGDNNDRPGDRRPGNNDGPLANRPNQDRPSTLPGMVTYPNRPSNQPGRPALGGGNGDDRVNIGSGGNRNNVNIGNVNVGGRNVGLNRPETLPADRRNWDNNQWGGNRGVWGNNVNIDNSVNVNIDNNFRRSNNFAYRPDYWGARPWWGAGSCHTWHHGHWGYGYNSAYYRRHWYYDDNDFAEGFMWGIAVWSLGNMVYDMGYHSYSNPYPAPPVQNTTIVYTQPISVSAAASPPGDEATASAAEAKSDAALDRSRTAFRRGDYLSAMAAVDEALASTPGDVSLHEYRALVLFALGKYGEASGVLNPVLASGPGWGWETMVGFYNSAAEYEGQLRKLEGYVNGTPENAAGHFLLGYHYLVCGNTEQSYAQFDRTAALLPADTIAVQLRDLTASSLPDGGQPGIDPAPRPAPVSLDKLTGTWTSDRGANGKVLFTLTGSGDYTWAFMNGDQSTEMKGTYGLDDKGLLVLTSDDTQMVCEVALESDQQMKFTLVGAPEGDPGLDFTKG